MTPETTHNLYSKKVLYIPDFILPQHVPKVYKYFENFNIAQLKNVNVFEHLEPEYNDLFSEDLFESLEEDDDFNDLTYEFTDSENEDGISFEYYIIILFIILL